MSFKLSNVKEVIFKQDMTFSDFLEQFQNYAAPLICLVDDRLHFYDKKENIPKNIPKIYQKIYPTLNFMCMKFFII